MDILLDLRFCYKVFNGAQDGLLFGRNLNTICNQITESFLQHQLIFLFTMCIIHCLYTVAVRVEWQGVHLTGDGHRR